MPTKKPRVTFAISEERLAEVEEYQVNNKLKNQSQAILALIEKGLSDFLPEQERKILAYLNDEEEKLVESYRSMNKEGQEALLLYAGNISSFEIYKKGRAHGLGTKEA